MCEFCGKVGRGVEPDERGRIDVWDLSRGWSVAPYPLDFVHDDGTTGDLFTCPACVRRLGAGESLRARAYLEGDEPTDAPATYSTRGEAIAREIAPALGEHADDFDLEAIAGDLLEYVTPTDEHGRTLLNRSGFRLRAGVDCWQVAQRHERGPQRTAQRVHATLCTRGEVRCPDWPLCGHSEPPATP